MKSIPILVLCLSTIFTSTLGSALSEPAAIIGPLKQTNLHFAVLDRNESAVRQLIESDGIILDAEDINGETPIFHASKMGQDKIVELLVNKGANVNSANNKGLTPLIISVKNGQEKVVEFLLEKNASVNTEVHINSDNFEPIMIEKYQTILPHIELESAGVAGITPLHFAATGSGNEKIIEHLVNHGANVNAKNSFRATPIFLATLYDRSKSVETLIEKGADVNHVDILKYTPLHWAVELGHEKTVDALILKGANIDAKELNDRTPLHVALKMDHKKIAQTLIAHGANESSKDKNGKTPREYADE